MPKKKAEKKMKDDSLNIAIEDTFYVIQRYRVSFLENHQNCNTTDMILIRSLIKMLSTCVV